MRILSLTRYGKLGASSRLRTFGYINSLNVLGYKFNTQCLIDNSLLLKRYNEGSYRFLDLIFVYYNRIVALFDAKKYDCVWIEKEALPWFPLWFEKLFLLNVPYILDYDDATFHYYDRNPNKILRFFYRNRINGLIAKASLVVCGNAYLASYATKAGALNVHILPTVVDLIKYPFSKCKFHCQNSTHTLRVVWIGSPSTVSYLYNIQDALRVVFARSPFVLRVIGADFNLPGIHIECIQWSEDTEAKSIADCDVGIMPLSNSFWEQGKCGYKLIQYMACGLPVIASPVGANLDIVIDGENGFLANDTNQWIFALEQLILNPNLRESMGIIARKRVEQKYSLQVAAPRLSKLLQSVLSESEE